MHFFSFALNPIIVTVAVQMFTIPAWNRHKRNFVLKTQASYVVLGAPNHHELYFSFPAPLIFVQLPLIYLGQNSNANIYVCLYPHLHGHTQIYVYVHTQKDLLLSFC